ncbi:hypothetical protein, partial [Nocardia abscessus]|uniref:hypothetical protein n=1 Tax=Nocardia abscessus TaxID=120957 RepID=UPI00245465B1
SARHSNGTGACARVTFAPLLMSEREPQGRPGSGALLTHLTPPPPPTLIPPPRPPRRPAPPPPPPVRVRGRSRCE